MASLFIPRFSSRPGDPHPWEPALSQLRGLPAEDLDHLIANWLRRTGLQPSRHIDRANGATTYRGLLGDFPFSFQIAVRVHQRDSRLQAHHVEAFLGYLSRHGLPAGVLITTGGCAVTASSIALGNARPRIRILSGAQWLRELVAARVGLEEYRLPRWVVNLRRLRWLPRPDAAD